jgi:cytoskeletal protein CcmA (bactofilin family)
VAIIGKSIVFKGDLSGDEDLQIDGHVEGGIQLVNHQLTIAESGRVQAQLYAKEVVIVGQVIGNVTATERVEILATGSVEGDIHTPRLIVAEGAVLSGAIEMTKSEPETQNEPPKSLALED